MDMGQFARKIRVISSNIPPRVDSKMVKVILAVDQALVLGTPVRTGRARTNWLANANSAASDQLPAPATPAQGETEALEEGEKVAANYKAGQVIHITNNLPYIQRLNEGSSKQAPAHYVEIAIQAALSVLRSGKIIR